MSYRLDPDEREAHISCAVANYISGVHGEVRTKAILVSCGLNAKEIDDILSPHRDAAFAAWRRFQKGRS